MKTKAAPAGMPGETLLKCQVKVTSTTKNSQADGSLSPSAVKVKSGKCRAESSAKPLLPVLLTHKSTSDHCFSLLYTLVTHLYHPFIHFHHPQTFSLKHVNDWWLMDYQSVLMSSISMTYSVQTHHLHEYFPPSRTCTDTHAVALSHAVTHTCLPV